MTYNVLAQCYVKSSWFPYCDPKALRWKTRSNLLKQQIEAFSPRPDILCMQECDNFDDFWKPTMAAMGYDSLYLKKTGNKKDGVGLFWLREKLEVLGGENVSLNDAIHSITDPDLQGRVIRDNVGVLAHFQFTSNSSTPQFIVASTHLFWDPAQADVKLAQTKCMLEAIEAYRASANLSTLPVFFAGDLNSMPGSEVYEYIVSRGFSSAYATYDDANGGEPSFTNVNGVVPVDDGSTKPAFVGTLDYIFYDSTKVRVKSLMKLMEYDVVTADGGALPNRQIGSDHLPLMAEFEFA
ncbi:hypothetical protein AC1031_006458 [Aphanomyces cochlioides]|nr:hypothetical protein AC1031_006458 [Aphanomyces cochlioides]